MVFCHLSNEIVQNSQFKLHVLLFLCLEMHEKLQQEYRELQLQHYQIKEEYDDIKEKMKFFTKVKYSKTRSLNADFVLLKFTKFLLSFSKLQMNVFDETVYVHVQ